MAETPVAESLVVIWSSGDREVARKMVFMYTKNPGSKVGGVGCGSWSGAPLSCSLTQDSEIQEELGHVKAATRDHQGRAPLPSPVHRHAPLRKNPVYPGSWPIGLSRRGIGFVHTLSSALQVFGPTIPSGSRP